MRNMLVAACYSYNAEHGNGITFECLAFQGSFELLGLLAGENVIPIGLLSAVCRCRQGSVRGGGSEVLPRVVGGKGEWQSG